MANINISVDQLVCENPVFTSVIYTGTRFIFDLNWTSNGAYYNTFDPTVTMILQIELFAPSQTIPYYTGTVSTPPPIPFNGTNFLVDILDYDNSYTTKDRIVFTLFLSGTNSCNTQTSFEIPENSIS